MTYGFISSNAVMKRFHSDDMWKTLETKKFQNYLIILPKNMICVQQLESRKLCVYTQWTDGDTKD